MSRRAWRGQMILAHGRKAARGGSHYNHGSAHVLRSQRRIGDPRAVYCGAVNGNVVVGRGTDVRSRRGDAHVARSRALCGASPLAADAASARADWNRARPRCSAQDGRLGPQSHGCASPPYGGPRSAPVAFRAGRPRCVPYRVGSERPDPEWTCPRTGLPDFVSQSRLVSRSVAVAGPLGHDATTRQRFRLFPAACRDARRRRAVMTAPRPAAPGSPVAQARRVHPTGAVRTRAETRLRCLQPDEYRSSCHGRAVLE